LSFDMFDSFFRPTDFQPANLSAQTPPPDMVPRFQVSRFRRPRQNNNAVKLFVHINRFSKIQTQLGCGGRPEWVVRTQKSSSCQLDSDFTQNTYQTYWSAVQSTSAGETGPWMRADDRPMLRRLDLDSTETSWTRADW